MDNARTSQEGVYSFQMEAFGSEIDLLVLLSGLVGGLRDSLASVCSILRKPKDLK